jgi:hypothetical protein
MESNPRKSRARVESALETAHFERINPHNRVCLGRIHGGCEDWNHCPYCGAVEQALRAVPKDVITF